MRDLDIESAVFDALVQDAWVEHPDPLTEGDVRLIAATAALAAANLLAQPTADEAEGDDAGLRERVEAVAAKWSCPPLENPGNTLVLRDLRAALATPPAPECNELGGGLDG